VATLAGPRKRLVKNEVLSRPKACRFMARSTGNLCVVFPQRKTTLLFMVKTKRTEPLLIMASQTVIGSSLSELPQVRIIVASFTGLGRTFPKEPSILGLFGLRMATQTSSFFMGTH
jgi:hypothetical protein